MRLYDLGSPSGPVRRERLALPNQRASQLLGKYLGTGVDILVSRSRSQTGLLSVAPAPLLGLALAMRTGAESADLLAPALTGLGATVVGMVLGALVLDRLDPGRQRTLRGRLGPDWGRAALAAAVGTLVTLIICLMIRWPGWGVGVIGALTVGIWAASAQLATSSSRRPFLMAPITALVGLFLVLAAGYIVRAGIVYYLGPPLAYSVVLAGHYLVFSEQADSAAGGGAIMGAYVVASFATVLAAWVDLL